MKITARQIIDSIPQRFRPEKASGFRSVVHFDITGAEPIACTIAIADDVCQLTKGWNGKPDCVIQTTDKVYVDLETGKANPQTALIMGKIKVSNLAMMMRFAKCFRKFDVTIDYSSVYEKEMTTEIILKERAKKRGPLSDVRILDFTRLLPGPLATMFLADLGADVVKIEDPDNPDYVRDFEPRIGGESMYYLALNRNKRSLAVNYLSPEGKRVIEDLVRSADVLIEQFRPGVMEEMGFGYERMSQLNPRLIYVSVTGYGQNSYKATHAGHDLNYIALAGALGINGTGGNTVIPGFQLADIAGGAYMAMNAVMAALYQREKTGCGEWVDVAMTDAVLPFTALQFAAYQGTKQTTAAGDFELSGALANYNVYACADGKEVALGSLEPKFWNAFCSKAQRADWAERFLNQSESERLKEEVRNYFLQKTRDEWLEFFKDTDVCITPVVGIDELVQNQYLRERNMLLENQHPLVGNYLTINQPLKFKQTIFDNNWSAPDLGDDTASVLRELNYTDAFIADIARRGVVKLKT